MRAPAFRWSDNEVAGLPVADIALAALLTVVAVVTTLGVPEPEGPLALTLPVALLSTGALAWRSRAPLGCLTVVAVAGLAQAASTVSPGMLWAFAALLVAGYSVARFSREGRAAIGGALLVGSLWVEEWLDGGTDYLFIAIVFGGVWLLGRAVRRWSERATVAEQNQDLRARNAVAEERVRIARELHDVVAHSVGVISVQANAAEAALDHDPELARAPLGAIRRSSAEALDEMRRLLALLRMDESETPARPQPGLADLDALVASMRAAGLPVTMIRSGDPARLPAGVGMSAYRIVQEALTNVLKHAGAVPTTVDVGVDDSAVRIEVLSPLPVPARPGSTGGGHGLVGIRERVTLLGGELRAGVDETGRYVVRARLPVGEQA